MVMPRARSSSIVSVCVVPLSTLPTDLMTPVSKRMRSVRLVLPASTCARIPRVTTAMRHTFVEAASVRWTLQRLPHGRLLCQCVHRSDSRRPPYDALRCDAPNPKNETEPWYQINPTERHPSPKDRAE